MRLPETRICEAPAVTTEAATGLYELSQRRSAGVGGQPWGLGCRDRPLLANPDMSAGTD